MCRTPCLITAVFVVLASAGSARADLITYWMLGTGVSDYTNGSSVDQGALFLTVQNPFVASHEAGFGPGLAHAWASYNYRWSLDGSGTFITESRHEAPGDPERIRAGTSSGFFVEPTVPSRLSISARYSYSLPPGDRAALIGLSVFRRSGSDAVTIWGDSKAAFRNQGFPPVATLSFDGIVDLPPLPAGWFYQVGFYSRLESFGGSPSQLSTGSGLVRLELRSVAGHLAGDANCDGSLDLGDVVPFTLALVDPASYAEQFPYCDDAADINADGAVNGLDISVFVDHLLNP